MERYANNVQDLKGNAVDNVTVTVRRVSDNGLATLFSDNGGTPTPLANPFTNDSDGELFFYSQNNRYNVELSGPVTEAFEDVLLLDPDELVFDSLELTSVATIDLVDSDAPLVVSLGSSFHLELDANEIQAKGNETSAAQMFINRLGGGLDLGPSTSGLGAVRLFDDTVLRLRTENDGVSVLGPVLDLDNSSVINATLLAIRNSEGGLQWRADGGDATLYQTNSGGATEDIWIFASEDAGVGLYYNGTQRFRTLSAGGEILGTSFHVNNSGDAAAAYVRVRNIEGGAALQANGGAFRIYQTDASGALENQWISMIEDAGVQLRYADTERVATTSVGVDLTGALVNLLGGGSDASHVIRTDGGGLSIRVQETTGNVFIDQTTAGGSGEDTWLQFVKNGKVIIYNNGLAIFETNAVGIEVNGTENQLLAASATQARFHVRHSAGGVSYQITSAGTMQIRQTSSGGTSEDIWIQGVRNSGIGFYFNGVEMFKTVDRAASGNAAGAQVKDGNGNYQDVGFNVMPRRGITGTTHTVARIDVGRAIEMQNASANTVTLPNDSTIPNDAVVNIVQNGAGVTSIATASGVTMRFSDGTSGTAKTVVMNNQYGWVTAYKVSDTVWYVTGAAT